VSRACLPLWLPSKTAVSVLWYWTLQSHAVLLVLLAQLVCGGYLSLCVFVIAMAFPLNNSITSIGCLVTVYNKRYKVRCLFGYSTPHSGLSYSASHPPSLTPCTFTFHTLTPSHLALNPHTLTPHTQPSHIKESEEFDASEQYVACLHGSHCCGAVLIIIPMTKLLTGDHCRLL